MLRLPPEQVRARLERALKNPEFVAVPIAENLGIEEVASIEARSPEHPEFAISISQRRLYSHGVVAAHALGYLAEATADQIKAPQSGYAPGDWIGQKGIEATYEPLLAGVNGERRVVVDSHGREIAEQGRTPAQPGQNLFTTLDLDLQRIAEDYFKERVGSVVAMDPKTGEILALVSSPSYDPNWFTRRVTEEEWAQLTTDPHHPLQNRAIQNAFSPGLDVQALPRVRGARGGARGSGRPRLLSRIRGVLRPRLSLPQQERPRLGEPARRDQGVVRRLLLQPRPPPRNRPHRRDLARASASASRPASTSSSRRPAWCRRKNGR